MQSASAGAATRIPASIGARPGMRAGSGTATSRGEARLAALPPPPASRASPCRWCRGRACVGPAGNQHVAAVLDALHLALHDAELGRVALVVGRVDARAPRPGCAPGPATDRSRTTIPTGTARRWRRRGRAREPLGDELVGLFARRRLLEQRLVAADGGEPEVDRWRLHAARLRRVVAAVPLRVVADRLVSMRRSIQLRPDIAIGRQAIGTSASMNVRVLLAPDPGLHAAHGIADHEAQVLHAQALGHQAVLREHHVVVVVAREFRAQAVGGLGRFPGAERVGQDDVVAARVERLARPEQLAGEVLGRACSRPSRRCRAGPAPARPWARRSCGSAAAAPGSTSPVWKRKSCATQSPSFGAG